MASDLRFSPGLGDEDIADFKSNCGGGLVKKQTSRLVARQVFVQPTKETTRVGWWFGLPNRRFNVSGKGWRKQTMNKVREFVPQLGLPASQIPEMFRKGDLVAFDY